MGSFDSSPLFVSSSFSFYSSPGEVRSLWAQLRRDEPHLLTNFEEFLARVTHQIKEAHQEKNEMESALQRWDDTLMTLYKKDKL